jgi:hypothetical protein
VAEYFANKFQTTLAAPLTSGATECTLASGFGPPMFSYRAIIAAEGANSDEIVLVTGDTGGGFPLIITRAVEAIAGVQVASAHAAGATFTAILTAEGLSQLGATPTLAEVLAAGNSTGGVVPAIVGADGMLLLDDGAAQIAGTDGAVGNPGITFSVSGGAGNAGADQPAIIAARGGSGTGISGRVGITTDASGGTIGQVLTAQGDRPRIRGSQLPHHRGVQRPDRGDADIRPDGTGPCKSGVRPAAHERGGLRRAAERDPAHHGWRCDQRWDVGYRYLDGNVCYPLGRGCWWIDYVASLCLSTRRHLGCYWWPSCVCSIRH